MTPWTRSTLLILSVFFLAGCSQSQDHRLPRRSNLIRAADQPEPPRLEIPPESRISIAVARIACPPSALGSRSSDAGLVARLEGDLSAAIGDALESSNLFRQAEPPQSFLDVSVVAWNQIEAGARSLHVAGRLFDARTGLIRGVCSVLWETEDLPSDGDAHEAPLPREELEACCGRFLAVLAQQVYVVEPGSGAAAACAPSGSLYRLGIREFICPETSVDSPKMPVNAAWLERILLQFARECSFRSGAFQLCSDRSDQEFLIQRSEQLPQLSLAGAHLYLSGTLKSLSCAHGSNDDGQKILRIRLSVDVRLLRAKDGTIAYAGVAGSEQDIPLGNGQPKNEEVERWVRFNAEEAIQAVMVDIVKNIYR